LLERPTFLFVILYIVPTFVRSFDKELPIWRLNRLIEGEQNHERTHIHTPTETTLSSFVVWNKFMTSWTLLKTNWFTDLTFENIYSVFFWCCCIVCRLTHSFVVFCFQHKVQMASRRDVNYSWVCVWTLLSCGTREEK